MSENQDAEFRKHALGFNPKEWDNFLESEQERLTKGAPHIDRLELPARYRNAIGRVGVRTTVGLGQVISEGRQVYGVPKKAWKEISDRLTYFNELNTPEENPYSGG